MIEWIDQDATLIRQTLQPIELINQVARVCYNSSFPEEDEESREFIKRLIIHIYDRYFNVVRYYGLYAKKHKFSDKFNHMLQPHVAEFRKQLKNWRCRIELYFKHDPLKCSCGHTFHFDYLSIKVYNTS